MFKTFVSLLSGHASYIFMLSLCTVMSFGVEMGWGWGYLYQIEGEFYDMNFAQYFSQQEEQVSAELQAASAVVR